MRRRLYVTGRGRGQRADRSRSSGFNAVVLNVEVQKTSEAERGGGGEKKKAGWVDIQCGIQTRLVKSDLRGFALLRLRATQN